MITANKVFVATDITSEIGKALAMDLAKTGEGLVMIAPNAEQENTILKELEAPASAYDRAAQQRPWEISERLTDLLSTKGSLPVNDPRL